MRKVSRRAFAHSSTAGLIGLLACTRQDEPAHEDELVHGGRASGPSLIARNELVIVVAKEAASLIRSLPDLKQGAAKSP